MTVEVTQGSGRWRRCPAEQLEILACGEDYVAYHRPSGKTHLLNQSSYQLLFQVLDEHREFAEIVSQCMPDDPGVDADEFVFELAMLLEDLEHLGLVKAV